jgi:hypothetical protein
MAPKWTEETARFTATDENGTPYDIVEYTEFFDLSAFDHPHQSLPGLKAYRLADGRHVNRISDDEFQIVGSGIKLRRMP